MTRSGRPRRPRHSSAGLEARETWVVADLSAGSPAGQSAAAQLARQLSIEAEPTPAPPDVDWSMGGHGWEYADFIARSIDREAARHHRGDRRLAAARRVSSELRCSAVTSCAVITPAPREVLSRYDRVFLTELGSPLAGHTRLLTIAWPSSPTRPGTQVHTAPCGPRRRRLRWCPVSLDAPLVASASGRVRGCPADPGPRRSVHGAAAAAGGNRIAASPPDYDRLAARQSDRAALAAFAQRRGNAEPRASPPCSATRPGPSSRTTTTKPPSTCSRTLCAAPAARSKRPSAPRNWAAWRSRCAGSSSRRNCRPPRHQRPPSYAGSCASARDGD